MDGTSLSNMAGNTLPGNWQLPSPGRTGYIQNTDTGVNGYLNANSNNVAHPIVVEEALDVNNRGQLWKRSADDGSGYFTLEKDPNPYFSSHFLVLSSMSGVLIIQGKYSCLDFFDLKAYIIKPRSRCI